MKLREKILLALFPTLKISSRWVEIWRDVERQRVASGTRVITILGSVVYLAHIIWIDNIYKLQPRADWIQLRAACIAICLVAAVLSRSQKVTYSRLYWLPMMTVALVCTYSQALSYYWYEATPYIFSVVIPAIAIITLRMGLFWTIVMISMCYLTVLPSWLERGPEFANVISAVSVTLMFVSGLVSKISTEINAFIADQNNLEAQRKIIEREIELNQQIKAFLPKEIYRRFLLLVEKNITPQQAMRQLLDTKEAQVACLHSDIRGFTKQTKLQRDFISSSAIPNIRRCTDLIEESRGVPKLVGDLVFSYFEGADPDSTLLQAVGCSFRLDQVNRTVNQHLPIALQIKRYILISFGPAVVGNIGGTDGAWDITVLGTPANVLSRLDLVTKQTEFAEAVGEDRIVLTREAAEMLKRKIPELNLVHLDLRKLNLAVRDFEELEHVYILPASESNRESVKKNLQSPDNLTRNTKVA